MLLARALRRQTTRSLSYLASIDQGTSSSRVILYDSESLTPVSSHQVELQSATTTPEPGWSQMDPAAILQSVDQAAQGALDQANASAKDVAWDFGAWAPSPATAGSRYTLRVEEGKLASTQHGGGIY